MKFKKWLDGVFKNASNKKSLTNLLVIFLLGLLMLITVNFLSSDILKKNSANTQSSQDAATTQTTDKSTSYDTYETQVEYKLKETLMKIQGVGSVEVMITFESGEEQVPAVNINDSTNKTEEKDTAGGTRNTTQENNGSTVVVTSDGDKTEPLIVKTYKPRVIGVCVVAEGAENNLTQLRISQAVTNLFDITEDKVNVYPMKK